MNAQGRVVVPLPIREHLKSPLGGTFIAYLEDERLILEPKGAARNRLFSLGAQLTDEDIDSDEMPDEAHTQTPGER